MKREENLKYWIFFQYLTIHIKSDRQTDRQTDRHWSLIFKLIQGYGGMHHWVKFCVNWWRFVCWSLTSLCHSNGHIETMPAREINPFTALTRIRSQFLRTQWSTSNHSEWIRLRLRPLSHRGCRKLVKEIWSYCANEILHCDQEM